MYLKVVKSADPESSDCKEKFFLFLSFFYLHEMTAVN